MTPNRETSFWHIGMVLILAAVVGYYTWDSANTIPEQVPVQIKATAVDKVEATTSRITLPRLENYPDKVIQNKVNAAIAAYAADVRSGAFPAPEHCFN